jgi:hypothetical protein
MLSPPNHNFSSLDNCNFLLQKLVCTAIFDPFYGLTLFPGGNFTFTYASSSQLVCIPKVLIALFHPEHKGGIKNGGRFGCICCYAVKTEAQ